MFIAIAATQNRHTIVAVVTNEATSLEVMSDFAALGNQCSRFETTAEMFAAYSNGADLVVNFDDNNKRYLTV